MQKGDKDSWCDIKVGDIAKAAVVGMVVGLTMGLAAPAFAASVREWR